MMGRETVCLVCAALCMMILSACSSSTPTGVARDLIHALEAPDKAELYRVFCHSSLADLISRSSSRVRFQDMVYMEHQQNDTAVVSVRGTVQSGTGEIGIFWRLSMKKKGKSWCVNNLQRADEPFIRSQALLFQD